MLNAHLPKYQFDLDTSFFFTARSLNALKEYVHAILFQIFTFNELNQ